MIILIVSLNTTYPKKFESEILKSTEFSTPNVMAAGLFTIGTW
ncbi:MAG: hypothetical protein ACI9WO_002257 [Sphingobacteriales bacterium]|jgi:hypothetical protein